MRRLARTAGLAAVPLGAALASFPALGAEEFGGQSFYFGELHAHTGLSGDGGSSDLGNCNDPGACGDYWAYFDTARYEAGLDFAAITDHINGPGEMVPGGWPDTLDLVRDAHDPQGGFVALMGAEMQHILEDQITLGHKNYLFFGDDTQLLGLSMGELQLPGESPNCEAMWADVALLDQTFGPFLLIPHHPAPERPMPTLWSCHDERYSPVVEIYSGHGNSRDPGDPYDPPVFDPVPEATVNEALDPLLFGHRLGVIGGTDLHDSQPGMVCHLDVHQLGHQYAGSLTGIFLEPDRSLDRRAIGEALVRRHTYATTGPRFPLLLQAVDDDGEVRAQMGDVLPPTASADVRLRVSLPAYAVPYVLAVELYDAWGNVTVLDSAQAGVYELELDKLEAPWFAYAIVRVDGETWWADQGVDCEDGGTDDEERIWSSPIWFDALDPRDDDGDGFPELGGDCDDHDPAVYPGAEEAFNGVDDDCDGEVDEGFGAVDGDGDGYTADDRDCDDTDPNVYPGADWACDGVADNDCDGRIDDDEADLDGDGADLCGPQPDCDDLDATRTPGAAEVCDGVDNDCDGEVPAIELDDDGDGWAPCDAGGGVGDCDDTDPAVHPGATEVDNGRDDDCDGDVDEGLGGCAGSCGIATRAAAPPFPWLAALIALLIRRLVRV